MTNCPDCQPNTSCPGPELHRIAELRRDTLRATVGRTISRRARLSGYRPLIVPPAR